MGSTALTKGKGHYDLLGIKGGCEINEKENYLEHYHIITDLNSMV